MNKKIPQSFSIFFLFSSILALYFYFYPPFFSTGWATSYLTFYPVGFPTNFFVILGMLVAVFVANGLEKRKIFFQITGILTLLYCGFLIAAQMMGAWFALLGIPFAIGSYLIWLLISECVRFLDIGLSEIPVSISVVSSIIFALVTVYCTWYVFADVRHVSATALNYNYLGDTIFRMQSSEGDYYDKEQQFDSLDLCSGFHNQKYTNSCEGKKREAIQQTMLGIAARSDDTPKDYCESYIKTIDGGSIQKNSDRYWSGLNMCYSFTAKNVSDCKRIENNEDLKQTCINRLQQ